MRHRGFEVAELSLSSQVLSLQADRPPFVALPVFASRMLRHGVGATATPSPASPAWRTSAARWSARRTSS
jgi:hypothetical protein